jgi:hypothetical protein
MLRIYLKEYLGKMGNPVNKQNVDKLWGYVYK